MLSPRGRAGSSEAAGDAFPPFPLGEGGHSREAEPEVNLDDVVRAVAALAPSEARDGVAGEGAALAAGARRRIRRNLPIEPRVPFSRT